MLKNGYRELLDVSAKKLTTCASLEKEAHRNLENLKSSCELMKVDLKKKATQQVEFRLTVCTEFIHVFFFLNRCLYCVEVILENSKKD